MAAAAVLMYHFVPTNHSLGWLFQDGWLGVPFFFILSGAVLSYSYLPQFADGQGISRRRFLALRFARIYPCYLLALAIALVPFVAGQMRATGSADKALLRIVGGVGMYLSLMQSWFTTPWTSGVIVSPAWSLSCEWFFYLTFCPLIILLRPVLTSGVVSARRLFVATCFFLVIFVAAENVLSVRYPTSINGFWDAYFWRGPFGNFPYFLGGIFVGRALQASIGENRPRAALAAYAGIAGLLLLFCCPVEGFGTAVKRVAILPVSAVAIYGLGATNTAVSRILGQPLFGLLGEASYPLYLLQFPLNDVFSFALPPPGMIGGGARLLGFTIVSVLAAVLIERPGRQLLRRLLLARHLVEAGR